MALTQLEPIMQTLQNEASDWLIAKGNASQFQMVEAYPDELVSQPTSTMIVVASVDQDDQEELELGGGLVREEFTFTFDVLGFGENAEAKALNIARHIKERFPRHSWVSITDFTQSPVVPSGEHVEVISCTYARLFFQNAKAWQEHWHSITLIVGYEYVPS